MNPAAAVGTTGSISTSQIHGAIAEIDERLASGPASATAYNDRGQLMELLGKRDAAVEAYINALRCEPTNVDALTALGLLTLSAGNRDGARTLLSGAVVHGPQHARAHANLAYLYVQLDHLPGARALYERALELDSTLAIAHHGLAQLLDRLGDGVGALEHRSLGLRYRPLTVERYTGDSEPIRVLALSTAAQGNIPTKGYFDNGTFLLASLTVEYADPATPLPPHDLIFNAIGEADLCAAQLARAQVFVARSDAPVINAPAAVAATSRAANAQRLRAIPGVTTARMVSLARTDVRVAHIDARVRAAGFTYPLLLRSPGYHTGEHFVKVENASELVAASATLPGDEMLVIEYLDVATPAGLFSKYRVMIVDGVLYPLHLAISRAWKVHYFSADMAENAENRTHDAAFLADMRAVLGEPVIKALERVRDVLALDFGGIDFAVDAAGDVVVFEANASMVVPLPDRGAQWDYRRKPVARIRRAVRQMLARRAGRSAADVIESVSAG